MHKKPVCMNTYLLPAAGMTRGETESQAMARGQSTCPPGLDPAAKGAVGIIES